MPVADDPVVPAVPVKVPEPVGLVYSWVCPLSVIVIVGAETEPDAVVDETEPDAVVEEILPPAVALLMDMPVADELT